MWDDICGVLHAEIWVVSHHINSSLLLWAPLIYTTFHYSVLQYLINVFPSSALLTVLTPQTIASGFFCASLREWRTKGRLISCPTDLVTPGSGTAVTSKFRNKSLSLISVSFYYILRMHSKLIWAFSDVSLWTRNFWKTLADANVDGEWFEMKT